MPWAIWPAVAVLGHVDVRPSAALPPKLGQIDGQSSTCRADADRSGHAPGRLQLEAVPLAIVDRQGVQREALLPGDRGGGGRVEPPGKEDHRPAFPFFRKCDSHSLPDPYHA